MRIGEVGASHMVLMLLVTLGPCVLLRVQVNVAVLDLPTAAAQCPRERWRSSERGTL